jgi:hypothetical protein
VKKGQVKGVSGGSQRESFKASIRGRQEADAMFKASQKAEAAKKEAKYKGLNGASSAADLDQGDDGEQDGLNFFTMMVQRATGQVAHL